MCTNPDRPWPAWDNTFDYDYKSIIKRLRNKKSEIRSFDSLYITGGEPTLHPDFIKIFVFIKKNFPKQRIKLLTNGRRFAYGDFAEKILSINENLEIDLSLYGHNEKTHDAVTRAKNSFNQTTAGLANILKYKSNNQVVGVRLVQTKFSYRHIKDELVLLVKKFNDVDRVIIIFHELEAQAVKNLNAIGVSYSKAKPYFEKTYPILNKLEEVRFYHFPLCTLDAKLWPYIWRTLPRKEVSFLEICKQCQFNKSCLGVHKGYLKYMGTNDFKPVKKKIIFTKGDNFHHPILNVNI